MLQRGPRCPLPQEQNPSVQQKLREHLWQLRHARPTVGDSRVLDHLPQVTWSTPTGESGAGLFTPRRVVRQVRLTKGA